MLPEATPARTLSVIVPTRNRAALWQSAWLMDSLRAQTEPPDELVIAVDHTDDDTVAVLEADLSARPVRFPVHVLEVLAPRSAPHPASGIPDNCALHAATSTIIIHVDDDIALPPDFCRRIRVLFDSLPSAVLWAQLHFVTPDGTELEGWQGRDGRDFLAAKHHWPTLPGGIAQLPPQLSVHWGAVFVLCARDIRAIGGHDLRQCGWHNTDTRLGRRLARSLKAGSFVTTTPALTALHLGVTWYRQNCNNPRVIRAAQSTLGGDRIANGGQAFWSSSWFDSAYKLTTTIPGATL